MTKTAELAPKANTGLTKLVTPSAALAEIIGSQPMSRTEVTKKLWAYIKKHDLQERENKRVVRADAALKVVFGGKETVDMFEMTKLVSAHLK